MNACRLIVHADDFGLSEAVNEGIIEAHRRGIVTSASIMASGRAFSHAVALALATPTLDIGVHLTLTEEEPVSIRSDVETLLQPDGRFHRHVTSFVRHYFAGRVALDDVECELDSQIARVSAALRVTHLDGHQHVHMLPGIRRVVGRLARKYQIPAVRFPREAPSPYMLYEDGSASRLFQMVVLNAFCLAADTGGAVRPDHFFGFFFGGRLTKANLQRVIASLPSHGVCELMCHPGKHDESSARKHWGYQWQDELDAMTDPEMAERLRARSVELTSYAALSDRI